MPEAEQKLTERFGLNWDSQVQDWDITNANAELLPVLLEALGDTTLTDDGLYSLMELTIASADEALQLDIDKGIGPNQLSKSSIKKNSSASPDSWQIYGTKYCRILNQRRHSEKFNRCT